MSDILFHFLCFCLPSGAGARPPGMSNASIRSFRFCFEFRRFLTLFHGSSRKNGGLDLLGALEVLADLRLEALLDLRVRLELVDVDPVVEGERGEIERLLVPLLAIGL